MRIPGYVYASVALIAGLLPATAFGEAVVTASVSPPPGDVPAGATVPVSCWAEGRPEGMALGTTVTIDSITVTVTGGSVAPVLLTGAVTQQCSNDPSKQCSVLQGSVMWTTSTTPGPLTARCTAAYTVRAFLQPPTSGTVYAEAPLTTVLGSVLPPVVTPMTGPGEMVVGTTSTFQVTASDPNNPPLPLTYAWTATGGTLTAGNSPSASWTAPSTPGPYDLEVAVSNGVPIAVRKTVSVVLATYQAPLLSLSAPQRIVRGENDTMFVVGRQGTTGEVGLLTARGEMRGFASLPEPATAVAQGAGVLWVTTSAGSLFRIDPTTGRLLGQVALADGPFVWPSGMAFDSSRMTLWVVEQGFGCVRVIHPDGTTVARIFNAAGKPLGGPMDVAVDSSRGRAWVITVVQAPGQTGLLHAFNLDGNYVGTFAPDGLELGQMKQGEGVTVGPDGRVFATDPWLGVVKVFESTGAPVGKIGSYGIGPGQLFNPSGLALLSNGDLAVASRSLSRIDRFGSGVPLPVCAGDADCDLLSDAWENAHAAGACFQDANRAGDALQDCDDDGLNSAEELALGTDPNKWDTDGDGFSDGAEVAGGFNPLDPNDHRPVVAASGPAETPPGLVRLSAQARDPDPASSGSKGGCTVVWTQQVGPAVTLSAGDPTGAATSFIGRKAATYAFDAVAVCGSARSQASRVAVAVRNVPPLADAGRVVVSSPSSSVRLDAWASSDANGDSPLKFEWDQSLGAPTSGMHSGRATNVPLGSEGLYGFQVTVADRGGASASAEVPVVVASGSFPTAVAAAFPSEAQVGSSVVLDASASVAPASSAFFWEQVAGPAAAVSGAGQPVASFVPGAAGRYAFDVTVVSGSLRSPPQRVEVFVAEAGGSLPTLTAAAPSIAAVNVPAALDATPAPGTGALEYSWRQVSGPAAGLTNADRISATAVPFAPGFYVFEVSAKQGAAESRPVRVSFEARSGNAAIPQARASVPRGDAIVGEVVYLDGRNSTGATRYRWTQVGGPWVALDAQAALTTFRPQVAGRYVFELEVDDGKVRSAPARVQVDVLPAEGGK